MAAAKPLRVLFLDLDGVLSPETGVGMWCLRCKAKMGIAEQQARVRCWHCGQLWLLLDGHWNPATRDDARPANVTLKMWEQQLDRAAVRRLNRIVRATGAGVVVSSTWRHVHPIGRLRMLLRARGFVGSIIGATPAIRRAKRGVECLAWLASRRRQVASFVALDDMDDYEPMLGRLVQTSPRDGLQDSHVSAAIDLLREPASERAGVWQTQATKALRNGGVTIAPPSKLLHPDEVFGVLRERYAKIGY